MSKRFPSKESFLDCIKTLVIVQNNDIDKKGIPQHEYARNLIIQTRPKFVYLYHYGRIANFIPFIDIKEC